jgi:prephenate dehydratase
MTIAFQGEPGAYSELACVNVFPDSVRVPSLTFEEAFQRVESGETDLAMIPLENSTAGRVEEIYHQIPNTRLFVIGEHFEPISHCLMAAPGSQLSAVTHVGSHPQALAQCAKNINKLGLQRLVKGDTAGAAQLLAEQPQPGHAAIASSLAAELYGLEILKRDFQDRSGNTTRFLVFSREERIVPYQDGGRYITSAIFRVRNRPAALYKALGGFATNGINLVKLESYMPDDSFQASQFYLDMEVHRNEQRFQYALEELEFYSETVRLIGTYPAHDHRYVEE